MGKEKNSTELSQKAEEIVKEILKNFPQDKCSEWNKTKQMQCFYDITYVILKKNHCTTTLGYFILEQKIILFLIHGDWSLRKEKMKEEKPLFMAKIEYFKQNKLQLSSHIGQDIDLGSFCTLEFELFEKITLVMYNYAKHVAGKA